MDRHSPLPLSQVLEGFRHSFLLFQNNGLWEEVSERFTVTGRLRLVLDIGLFLLEKPVANPSWGAETFYLRLLGFPKNNSDCSVFVYDGPDQIGRSWFVVVFVDLEGLRTEVEVPVSQLLLIEKEFGV